MRDLYLLHCQRIFKLRITVLLQRPFFVQSLSCNLSVGMLCLSCKGIFLALRRGPWSCDSACSSELDEKLNVLQIYPWEPDWPAWVSCNLLLLSYPLQLHDDNPELEVWSNGFLLQFWYVKLYNNFYSVKYTGYLNILLQIVFIVRTVKGTNCLGNLISWHLKKSLLNLSTLSDVNF